MSRFDRKRRRKAVKAPIVQPAENAVFLSGCVIVRDGAEDLAWCLESFQHEVDEIIVVDTGSKDATKEIAHRYTPHVYDFAWREDFAAARNFALSKAHGKWAFFPDSDERLADASRGGKLRKAARMAGEQGADALELIRHEIDLAGHDIELADNPAVRMMKIDPGLRYREPIHEYLVHEDGHPVATARIFAKDILLLHRGYAPERRAEKTARNLALLEKMEREGVAKPYLHYYLTGIYVNAGRWEDACREAELSIAAGEHPSDGALDIWLNYQTAVEKLGDEARLRELCERTIRVAPGLPQSYVRLGVFEMIAGNYEAAEQRFVEALRREKEFSAACPDDYDIFQPFVPQVEHLLADCRKELGKESPAAMADNRQEERLEERDAAASRSEEAEPMKESEKAGQPQSESLAERIPPRAKCIVAFGAGETAERAFLRRQPAARWLERGTDAATETELSRLGLSASGVDCIVYGTEAAEQATTEALRAQAACLAEDGQMVFELENPAYFRRLLQLLAGQAAGHSVLPELVLQLRAAGLAAILLEPQYEDGDASFRQDPEVQRHFDDLRNWGGAHGIIPKSGTADIFAARYVVRAVKQKTPPMLVQTLIGEQVVTARPRVWVPNSFLQTEPGFDMRSSKELLRKPLAGEGSGNIVIRQRRGFGSVEEAEKMIHLLHENGYLSLYECDDNPVLWKKRVEASKYLDYRGVHAVQVSTEGLAELIRPYNPHVFVFENQLAELPEARDYAAEEAAHPGRVTVFFGAVNREVEWKEIVPALNVAAKRYGKRLWFQIIADRPCYDMLETECKEFLGDPKVYDGKFVPYAKYQKALHTSDIALLPLRDNEFNRTKSDLKFIECAGHGVTVLASPTVYERTVVDGCTGCIYRSPEEFSEKLAHLIEDADYRHAIARAAYGYVKENRLLSQHYMERVEAYRWMAAHQDELEAELEERLKEIR